MNIFYFNSLLPDVNNNELIVSSFSKTYIEYDKLKKKYPEDIEGIVTNKGCDELYLNSLNFSIADCIKSLERSMRFAAFSTFRKHPFYAHFTELDEDAMLENEYVITVDGNHKDAYYLKVVADNSGFAFTIALNNSLTIHPLVIKGSDGSETSLNNLYGHPDNTVEIENIIIETKRAKMGSFEKLLDIVGGNAYGSKFKNAFEKYNVAIQNSIIEHIEKAIDRKGVSKFFTDDDLIKNVTPSKEKKISVSELRIFDPVALRLYFYETDMKMYLASIEKKPTKEGRTNEQDNQIKNAHSSIKQLVLLDNRG